jgi:hypothetical protein
LDFRSDILAYHLCEDVDLVFGHYQVTTRLMDAHPEYEFVTMLRDPVARFISHFYYNQATQPAWAERFTSIEEFISTADESAQNLGHTYVSHLGLENPRTVDSIASAKRVLDRFILVGITEEMAEFVHRFQIRYGMKLDVGYKRISKGRPHISDGVLGQIREICYPNIELYKHAWSLRRVSERTPNLLGESK